jgi:hypothetical protein
MKKRVVVVVFNNKLFFPTPYKFDLLINSLQNYKMDFLKDLLELNNIITLQALANEQNLDDLETEKFIQKYNKRNNRLFTPIKEYKIDEYKMKVERYQLSTSSSL